MPRETWLKFPLQRTGETPAASSLQEDNGRTRDRLASWAPFPEPSFPKSPQRAVRRGSRQGGGGGGVELAPSVGTAAARTARPALGRGLTPERRQQKKEEEEKKSSAKGKGGTLQAHGLRRGPSGPSGGGPETRWKKKGAGGPRRGVLAWLATTVQRVPRNKSPKPEVHGRDVWQARHSRRPFLYTDREERVREKKERPRKNRPAAFGLVSLRGVVLSLLPP